MFTIHNTWHILGLSNYLQRDGGMNASMNMHTITRCKKYPRRARRRPEYDILLPSNFENNGKVEVEVWQEIKCHLHY